MKIMRRKTKAVRVRNLIIGGNAPISIQSMTNVSIENVKATIEQINRLAAAGADLIRLAIINEKSLYYLRQIRKAVDVPLSADIHFNYKLALGAIEGGIDKIRINPGNIGKKQHIQEIVKRAKEHSVPIRIGVNGGSLDKRKYPILTSEALVNAAIEHVQILEDCGFEDIVVSIKTSDIHMMIEANKLFAGMRNYPLHIGLTEAGYGDSCIIQSSIAIGHLLLLGYGDTIRVSMTGDPVNEVIVAQKILDAIGLRTLPIRIIACPTCGRTDPNINLEQLAQLVEKAIMDEFSEQLRHLNRQLKVAIMGCEVNGPGEASHADVGIAGARSGNYLLFSRGEKISIISRNEIIPAIMREVSTLLKNWKKEI